MEPEVVGVSPDDVLREGGDGRARTIVVAPYGPHDHDGVIDVVLAIQQREFGIPITLGDQPDLADVPAHYGRGRGGFWVARDADGILGTIGLLDAGEPALRKMFVQRELRGSEHRIAARLLEALLAHANERAIRSIWLGTRPEMRAAHRFYQKHGFVRVAPDHLPPAFPRVVFDSVFYRLDL
jgi:GNAT superfamily N-acetyltransferase